MYERTWYKRSRTKSRTEYTSTCYRLIASMFLVSSIPTALFVLMSYLVAGLAGKLISDWGIDCPPIIA